MLKAVKRIYFHKKGQIKRPGNLKKVLLVYFQFFLEDLQKAFIRVLLNLQTDDLAPLPSPELFFNLLQQIHRLLLIERKVSIPHDTEWMGSHNVIVQEKLLHVALNDLLQEDHLVYLPGMLPDRHRQHHHPWKHGRHLYHRKFQFSVP